MNHSHDASLNVVFVSDRLLMLMVDHWIRLVTIGLRYSLIVVDNSNLYYVSLNELYSSARAWVVDTRRRLRPSLMRPVLRGG